MGCKSQFIDNTDIPAARPGRRVREARITCFSNGRAVAGRLASPAIITAGGVPQLFAAGDVRELRQSGCGYSEPPQAASSCESSRELCGERDVIDRFADHFDMSKALRNGGMIAVAGHQYEWYPQRRELVCDCFRSDRTKIEI